MGKFGPNVIDEWLKYLRELKKLRISDVYLNSDTSTVQLVEKEGVLILRLYSDTKKAKSPSTKFIIIRKMTKNMFC
jgi:hypothetical protein